MFAATLIDVRAACGQLATAFQYSKSRRPLPLGRAPARKGAPQCAVRRPTPGRIPTQPGARPPASPPPWRRSTPSPELPPYSIQHVHAPHPYHSQTFDHHSSTTANVIPNSRPPLTRISLPHKPLFQKLEYPSTARSPLTHHVHRDPLRQAVDVHRVTLPYRVQVAHHVLRGRHHLGQQVPAHVG